MYTNDAPDTTTPRRRIIQQPLRTEAPVALIASDGVATGELSALLKRAHPLISFPSLSHFLAEPPQRWAAIVVARSGAWDARLEQRVRRRRCVALFGLTEEGYGWPEDVARLREVAEVEPWLEGLNAPDPILEKLKKKRPRPVRVPKAAVQGVLPLAAPSSVRPAAPTQPPAGEARGSAREQTKAVDAAPQTELPAQLVSELLAGRASAGAVEAQRTSAAARRARKAKPEPTLATRDSEHKLAAAKISVASLLAYEPTGRERAADHAFLRAASELGLLRAREVLDELCARASQLALTLAADD